MLLRGGKESARRGQKGHEAKRTVYRWLASDMVGTLVCIALTDLADTSR